MCVYVCVCVCVERYATLSLYFKSFTTSANILKRAALHSTPPLPSPPDQRMDSSSLKRRQRGKQLFRSEINGGREVCCWFPGLSCMRWLECWSYNRRQSPFPVCVFCLPSRGTAGSGTGLKKSSRCNSKEEDQPIEERRK